MIGKNKQVLGRGLDALISPHSQTTRTETSETDVHPRVVMHTPESKTQNSINKIKLSEVEPNPFQPRTFFDKDAMENLKQSIISNGLIQPISVRKLSSGNYQIISGERRFRAFKDLGFLEITAYILDVVTDETMLAMALIENIQRENLNPIEVGLAYQRLLEECNLTHEDIAQRVGKDRTTITNSIRLLKLPAKIQESLINGEISTGHARALVNVPDIAKQIALLEMIIKDSLSVRKVEELVKHVLTATGEKKKISRLNNNKYNGTGNLTEFEDRLRRIMGTKVSCKQKTNGTGEIVLEYYSQEEFERLIELFYAVENNFS